MKQLIRVSLLLITSLFILSSCTDDDGRLHEKDLPSSTLSFIEHYLPNYQILQIEDLHPQGDDLNKYKVTFSDDLEIIFNTLGYWWHAESKTEFPESLLEALDSRQLEAIKKVYPNEGIRALYNDINFEERYKDVYFDRKIVLTDGTELILYEKYSQVIVAENIDIASDKVPDGVRRFISEHYDNASVDFILRASEDADSPVYKVYLSGIDEAVKAVTRYSVSPAPVTALVILGEDGEWQSIYHSAENFPVSDRLLETMTPYAQDYLAKEYPEPIVYMIEKQEEWYNIRIGGRKGIIALPYDKAPVFRLYVVQSFIWEHFNAEYIPQTISVRSDESGKDKRYYITVTIHDEKEQVIKMESLADGVWLVLETPYGIIPESVFGDLPSAMKAWLDEKGALSQVRKIVKTEDSNVAYVVKINNTELGFDENGAHIGN